MANPDKKRPKLQESIYLGIQTDEEEFQNRVVRPIIKMQSDLILAHVKEKIRSTKTNWNDFPSERKSSFLTQLLTKDNAFKREIIGMIIGQFSLEEHRIYCTMQKEMSRRITQIVLNRSADHLLNSSIS
jgi:hypothetical protein